MNAFRRLAALVFILQGAPAQAGKLEFPEVLKEVNAAADAKSVIVDFPFTNKTAKPVTITKSDPKCACLSVQISGGKFTYAPGESGVVRTTMVIGNLLGTQKKSIDLWFDQASGGEPSLHLNLIVHIPDVISLDQKTVHWGMGSKLEPKTIHIVMDGRKPIHITRMAGGEDSFHYELKTLELGQKYDLIVTPTDTKTPVLSVIRLETDCEISKHKTIQVFAQVRKLTAAEVATQP